MVQCGLRTNILGLVFLASALLFSCRSKENRTTTENKEENAVVVAPAFDADSAYQYVKKQVEFGPRIPNSTAHKKCAEYLKSQLKKYTDTLVIQKGNITVFDGKTFQIENIMGMINPKAEKRVLLCSHWDSRPWADQDTTRKDEPIDAANDGASGVGVLIEVARQLTLKEPEIGVDILFLDLEDYGQPSDSKFPYQEDSYALGTQYWAKNIPVPLYRPMYGILLDMVGAPNATFGLEGNSREYAPGVLQKVWAAAAKLGYSSVFINKETGSITDDHYYINEIARIPTIDIIHHDSTTPHGFGRYWHTHADNMNAIDKNTLKAVGQTLLEVIYSEK